MEILCKANGAFLHYVLASFALFTLSDLRRVSSIAGHAGKAASYLQNASVEAYSICT